MQNQRTIVKASLSKPKQAFHTILKLLYSTTSW
jgi:hypothetical protein